MTVPHDILSFVHCLLAEAVTAGDTVLDATAGNGHDTLYLAQCVGQSGRVWAFDIQESALNTTRKLLTQAGLHSCVRFICDNHCRLEQYISEPLAAAVFNLGYLPHGDKTLTTQSNSTLPALRQSLDLLQDNGILAVVLYGGHPAGTEECAAVEAWAQALAQQQFDVLRYQFANRPSSAPYALTFRKKP